jgi:hypothetical protein
VYLFRWRVALVVVSVGLSALYWVGVVAAGQLLSLHRADGTAGGPDRCVYGPELCLAVVDYTTVLRVEPHLVTSLLSWSERVRRVGFEAVDTFL